MLECRLDNHTISFLSLGEGHPIVILHGGGPNDHRYMQSDFEPLFEGRTDWRRIYVDLPGHGQTAWPGWVERHDQIVDLLCEFIDRVIPGERFTLAGLSWGGQLSLGIVGRRAEMVEGLCLSVPQVIVETAKQNLPDDVTLVNNDEFLAGLEEDERWIGEVITVQDPAFLERLRRQIFAADRNNKKYNRDRNVTRQPLSQDVGHIRLDKPALIITGRQDNVVGFRDAWDLLENFPRATFAVLDRASHFLSLEQNGLMMALVDEWLDRVEESKRMAG